jgi:signal transduction histidine kinase
MRCQHAAVYQRNPGENELKLVGKFGSPLPEDNSRASAGLVGRADHWSVPIWVNQEGPGDEELRQVLNDHGLGTVICTPVARGEGGLVFMAARDSGQEGFQLADLETFGLLARQADVALENARLYGELRAYVRQVEESQRALLQAEKMSAVGRLTASIAHEVNNPLQAMSNCLHLVGRDELEEGERESYLKLAQEELDRLMKTVQRMLDFYRPGALNREQTDLNELINRVLTLLEKQLLNKNIEVKTNFDNKLPSVIVVSNQMQQVFFNLIINAMEAMPDGGKLEITTKRDKINVEAYLQDNGVGISPEIRNNIFEPFMTTREDGTGLGLSVSYGILTAHGGNLELVPGKGKGTCFRVSLPIEEAK